VQQASDGEPSAQRGGRLRLGENVTDAEQKSPLDPDVGEIPPEESGPDADPGEIQPKEKRPWLAGAKSRLLSGLGHGRRYGSLGLRCGLRYGLQYGRRYGRLGLRYGLRWGWPVVLWFAVLSLSFLVLVRGSMFAYQSMGWGTWSSIGLGVFGTIFIFSAYLAWLWTRITGEDRLRQFLPRGLIAVVAGYSMYGLLYMSAGNLRDPELRDHYTSLHPLMRLGASTYVLFDRNGVVTDPERTAEDYLGMGLPMNEMSLHFKLGDRYIRAMDLRTTGRSTMKNRLTVTYFRSMGFRSLHHVSAADHLHVSLPVRAPSRSRVP
jgi:hypothetical protein